MELSELLQWLSQSQKTGTLVIDSGEVNKRVFFDQGRIVASGSTKPSEQLGHFLVSQGFITEVELTKAISLQEETGMLLGKILVTIGGITEGELRRILILKTEETLYDIFSWTEGEFRFLDNEIIERGIIPIALDVTAIVLQGINRLDEWARIRKLVPDTRGIPVSVASFEDLELSETEHRVLSLIDDDRSIEELCVETHSNEFHVCRILHRQIQEGRLKVVRPRHATPPPPEPVAAPEPVETPTGSLRIDANILVDSAEEHLAERDFENALRHLRAARSLEPTNKAVLARIKHSEDGIANLLRAEGLDLGTVPVLERKLEDLVSQRLSPEEGFLLTRIDGTNTMASLLRLSPLSSLDAQLVFFKLLKAGHIRLERATA
jgi:hypothetical protein